MPFTFSHPAIVLPLAVLPRRRFSATGLIAGSMAPDFEYFLRMKVHSAYSHTLWGLAALDLPLGILMAFVFHELVKPSLIPNLPGYLQVRYSPFAGFSWRRYFTGYWPVVCYSVLLGAASHVLWDSFTHEHGYFVENWQALTGMVTWGSMEVPVYKVLQHGSTLAGALMILLFIHKLPAGNQSTQSTDFRVLGCSNRDYSYNCRCEVTDGVTGNSIWKPGSYLYSRFAGSTDTHPAGIEGYKYGRQESSRRREEVSVAQPYKPFEVNAPII